MDISIIITTYNYAGYIGECVDSCLFQEEAGCEYEVIVVDDGSIDRTPLILAELTDKRLHKFRTENCGIEEASNFGFRKARGRFIVRVDADDKLFPNYLRDIRQYLDEPASFFYPDYTVINAKGDVLEHVDLPDFQPSEIRQRGDFLATGTLYAAKTISQIGGYSTLTRNSGVENYELILRLLRLGLVGKHVPHRLFSYRRHSVNISETKREQIIRNGRMLFHELGLGAYRTNKNHPYKLKLESR